MSLNIERARELLAFLTAHPEQHTQSHFVEGGPVARTIAERRENCGTTGCVAGWTVLLFGPRDAYLNCSFINVRGCSFFTSDVAGELLGIADSVAEVLFFETLSVDDPEQTARDMLAYLIEHPAAGRDELRDAFEMED